MLEVCFSCKSKIIAQVRSATVVLRGANFRGAKVSPEQLGKAKSLEGIIMPDGSMPYGRYTEPDWTPEWYSNLQP
jgi:hypothetical protein